VYSTIYISLYEYVKGCRYKLEYLDKSTITITIPECDTKTIILEERGLYGLGSLILFIKVDLPKKEELNNNKIVRHKLIKYLKNISNAPQNGLLLPKSI
jgi:DnaJ-class molecular chaperone